MGLDLRSLECQSNTFGAELFCHVMVRMVLTSTDWFVKYKKVNSQLHVVSECSPSPIICISLCL